MRIELVQIGNSHGVRLPKAVIQQAGLTGELDLEVAEGAVVLRAVREPRAGWAEAAAACAAEAGDDVADWDATAADAAGDWE